jgi:hypothetical protein
VVQTGQDWDGDNDTGPLDRPTPGRILAQRQVRARLIVIRRIRSKNSPQVRLTKDQQSVQALAAHGVDQAFRIAILPASLPKQKLGSVRALSRRQLTTQKLDSAPAFRRECRQDVKRTAS